MITDPGIKELMFLGAAFLAAPNESDEVVRRVDSSCFTRPTLAKAWQSIIRQWGKGDYADPWLTAVDVSGEADPLPVYDALAKAAQDGISGAFLRPRAEQLLTDSTRRELQQFGHETIQDAATTNDLDGMIAYIARFAETLEDMRASQETGDLGPIADRVEAAAASGRSSGWLTGMGEVDAWAGGLHRGRVHMIGGAPGSGKTWVAAQWTNAMVDHGELVVSFPVEMPPEDTYVRLMANRIGFKAYRLNGENRTWAPDEHELYRTERAALEAHVKMFRCNRIADIAAHVRALRPAMFVVDFVQLMANPPGTKPGYEAQTENANALLDLCHKTNSAMVLVTQIGREALRAGASSAVLGSRDSGRWDEIAELFVNVTDVEPAGGDQCMRLHCRKNRHGITGRKATYRLDPERGKLVPK